MGIFSSDERHIEMPPYVPPPYEIRKRVYHNGHTAVKILFRFSNIFSHHEVWVVEGKMGRKLPKYQPFVKKFAASQEGWTDAIEFMETL